MRTSTVIKAVLAATALTPLLCQAESNLQTGNGALNATAHVDFQINIPKFLFLRVGTGTGTAAVNSGWATNGTIDLITFTPTPANLGNGVAVAATAGSGDLGNGVETAVVVGNDGDVTFSSTTTGQLGDGTGDNISFTQINSVAAHNTTGTTLAAPALVDNGSTTITLTSVAKIVQQDAQWTYTYKNTTIPPAGTYGGQNANNSRVLYTASAP
jgi:hypothetical protein